MVGHASMLGRTPVQRGHPEQWASAMRTKRLRFRSWNLAEWSGPIQQRQDALPSGLGSRTQPAVVAHTLKAAGQDVLKESADELHRRHGQDMPLLILTVTAMELYLKLICPSSSLRRRREP